MPISASWRAGAAGLALAAAALSAFGPALGQERPESILPPGFGEPAATPTPRPTATPRAVPSAAPTAAPTTGFVQPLPPPVPSPTASASPTATPTATPTIDRAVLAEYEMPSYARRSLDLVGPAGPREGALTADAFGSADGRYLEELMRRLSAPLPSRWLSILLRRTVAAQLATPARVNGADFAAERAWLLLRMGEADAARAVVQSVDTANYTPKLYEVALNAMLAAGDPAGLCPLANGGSGATGEPGWLLAQAMCAGLSGDQARAKQLTVAARRQRAASGIDLQLAQKVMGAGPDGGQAVTIEWDAVDQLTIWRFGIALATGVAVPDTLMATVGPQVNLWRAVSPGVPLATRVEPAEAAAAQGVLSNAALVDLYGALDEDNDASGAATTVSQDLRTAYAAATGSDRLTALRTIWGGDATTRPPYARLVLTAHAAARIRPRADVAEADRLIASMLSAGLDRTASRWRGLVPAGSDGWAMLELADPDITERLSYSDLASYSGSGDAALKQRMLFAGLAALGRLAPDDVERAASALDVRIGATNVWTQALDRAVRDQQPGTVVVLAAMGMQTGSWKGVPPAQLYRIVSSLRAVGLGGEARMIAAEAIARA